MSRSNQTPGVESRRRPLCPRRSAPAGRGGASAGEGVCEAAEESDRDRDKTRSTSHLPRARPRRQPHGVTRVARGPRLPPPGPGHPLRHTARPVPQPLGPGPPRGETQAQREGKTIRRQGPARGRTRADLCVFVCFSSITCTPHARGGSPQERQPVTEARFCRTRVRLRWIRSIVFSFKTPFATRRRDFFKPRKVEFAFSFRKAHASSPLGPSAPPAQHNDPWEDVSREGSRWGAGGGDRGHVPGTEA